MNTKEVEEYVKEYFKTLDITDRKLKLCGSLVLLKNKKEVSKDQALCIIEKIIKGEL